MLSPDQWQPIAAALEQRIRAWSGAQNVYNSRDNLDYYNGVEEPLVNELLNTTESNLAILLASLDQETLVQIIFDFADSFGDTSTEEGEKRLASLKESLNMNEER